jgi:CBS domain-containing protein
LTVSRVLTHELSEAIRAASSVEALAPLAARLRDAACALFEQGAEVPEVTGFISHGNDLLSARIIEMTMPPAAAALECCWIVMGSEGRREQTLHTDQDNAIIFAHREDQAPDEIRALLGAAAREVNAAMNRCGIPLCRGGIMAGNPQWCLSIAEWKERFARWIDRGDPHALLNATIFFDFRALHGAAHLAEALRDWLAARAAGHSRFLLQMTQNALGNRPPLGLFGGFVLATHGGIPKALDLKVNAVTPFVDAARIYSLATGVKETGTANRLRAAAAPARISPAQTEACVEAFLAMQRLRMQLQVRALAASKPPGNVVDPRTLPESDRAKLKTAMREALRLQKRLARDYASVSGYSV